jgi:hypothetical protein
VTSTSHFRKYIAAMRLVLKLSTCLASASNGLKISKPCSPTRITLVANDCASIGQRRSL